MSAAPEVSPRSARPWHRPGIAAYAAQRVRGILRPPVTITLSPATMRKRTDVEVPMRDGVILRVDVFLPSAAGPFPVILCAHPYGKDASLPRPTRRGWRPSFPYRLMRQPAPVSISDQTGWEAPDPAWWTARGYAVVNADLRGCGHSDGVGTLMSAQEGDDVCDLVEWAGAQSWSTGRVGMLGVSYLAMSQYRPAALHAPSLAAICPWEGFTDAYQDLFTPDGVAERGFSRIWQTMIRRTARLAENLGRERARRPLRDAWWDAKMPDLSRIEVPMLVCGSFSDNNLHSRGSFRAFEKAASTEKFLWTHRGGKWATFYSAEALEAQRAFFDRYVAGRDAPLLPRVRLEVRESGDRVAEVRTEEGWPLARAVPASLFLAAGGALAGARADGAGSIRFSSRRGAAAFTHVFESETEITGPAAVDLWVSVSGADDVRLFVGLEKWRGERHVDFEGSYGYGRDRVTSGWQRLALRELDADASTLLAPVHPCRTERPVGDGEIVPVRVALGPSSTLFHAGDTLRLVVAGRPLDPRNPLFGHFPAWYARSRRAECTLHWGSERPARAIVPVVPRS